jgi:REP element-mobilizing transposase RayT
VTQRGNRRRTTFFGEDDDRLYRALLAEHARAAGVAVWAWCLMPDHGHRILVPKTAAGLMVGLRESHRRYARHVNRRERWHGYLGQGRFASCILDEAHLLAAARCEASKRGRTLLPSEFRALCAFICSIQTSYITGHNFLINGGAYPGIY